MLYCVERVILRLACYTALRHASLTEVGQGGVAQATGLASLAAPPSAADFFNNNLNGFYTALRFILRLACYTAFSVLYCA